VLALSDRTELSNNAATRLLDASDRALLAHASSEKLPGSREITLSDGSTVVAHFDDIESEGRVIGSLVTIEAQEPRPVRHSRTQTRTRTGSSASEYVGRSASSNAIRSDAQTMSDATFPLLITGEAGVGKLRLAKIIARAQDRVVMLDARSYTPEEERGLLREVSALSRQSNMCVILRHVNTVPADVLQEVGALARAAEKSGSRVIATATSTGSTGQDMHVPIGVRLYIPALRERPEDILDLVPHLLARQESPARLSPAVLQTLLRCDWPGNVRELDMVLAGMVHRSGQRELTLADLPAHYQRGTRKLRRIEQVERTAILQALSEADGNKTQAARILEIGRATLYRKMRIYGLGDGDLGI
jgi:transcriptional regulator of acetoin/glycerol metabolism